jgi:undecaprenyl-diphosphatase
MSVAVAAILGVIQALTEFLPVSSTAHLLVFGELFGQDLGDARFRAFTTIIQMGTTLAVIVFFREDLARIVVAGLKSFPVIARRGALEPDMKLAWLIVLGTVPAAVAGLLFEKRIEGFGNYVIAGSLVVLGLVLLGAEVWATHAKTIAEVGPKDALAIGCGQAIALVPGSSRSGLTITAALLLGFKREDAARFSFLLSVPIVLGAGLYKLKKALPVLAHEEGWRTATVIGTVIAAVVGYLVIGWLLSWLRTRTTYVFVAWRILAGLAIAVLIWKGVLPAGGETEEKPPPTAVESR